MNILGLEISFRKTLAAEVVQNEVAIQSDATKSISERNLSLEAFVQNSKAFQASNNIINMNVASYPQWSSRREVESYVTIDDVYSIISLLATTAALIPLYGYTVKDAAAFKEYRKYTKECIQKKHFQIKSMQDLPETDPVYKLLQNPNGARFEFFEALYTLLFINGEVFLWKERIQFGVNAGVTKLHILFPSNMTVFVSTVFPSSVTGYRYLTTYGANLDFTPDEIIHVKYANPRSLYNQQYRGMSPLTPFNKRLTLMDSTLNNSVAQMQNGGVPTIVFDKSQPNTKEAIEAGMLRKEQFSKFLNNSANKGAPYFASGELGAIATGLKLVDMDSVNLTKQNFSKLCNGYHVSDVLLNNDSAATESNVQIQTKRMYTNTILPNIRRVQDALTIGLLLDFKGPKRTIEADISGVTELQDDMQKQATALGLMQWITPNEKRQIQGFDESDEEYMDKIIIGNQQILLSDLGGVPEPVDPANPEDPANV